MPVRISTHESSDPASFAVSEEKLQEGIENFKRHYFLADGSAEFTSDFSIPWNYLEGAVNQYQTDFPEVAVADIAMRFVHCYNTATDSLFLRLLICQMQLTTATEYNSLVYQLLNNNCQAWYDVAENALTPTLPPAQTFTDPVYLSSFEYKLAPNGSGEVLADDGGLKFVRTLTFPWQAEIYQMYEDNGSPTDPPDNVRLHFCSCSYTEAEPGADSVLWPHGLVLYLEVNDEKLLNNDNTVSMFSYRGCDLATLCPPRCNSYVSPAAMV